MEEKEREVMIRFLINFRDTLAQIVERINEFLEESVPKKGFSTKLLAPSGDLLAEVYESAREVRFEISPDFRIPLNNAILQDFLVKNVLEGIRGKGLSYRVEDEGGKLKAITVEGAVPPNDVDSLRRAVAWTLLKAGGGEYGA